MWQAGWRQFKIMLAVSLRPLEVGIVPLRYLVSKGTVSSKNFKHWYDGSPFLSVDQTMWPNAPKEKLAIE